MGRRLAASGLTEGILPESEGGGARRHVPQQPDPVRECVMMSKFIIIVACLLRTESVASFTMCLTVSVPHTGVRPFGQSLSAAAAACQLLHRGHVHMLYQAGEANFRQPGLPTRASKCDQVTHG